jgi:tetratricopeptide (TPR) repeat protein
MQCPSCALYHPARYENCVSCGAGLVADGEMVKQSPAISTRHSRNTESNRITQKEKAFQDVQQEDDGGETADRRTRKDEPGRKKGIPTFVGVVIAGFILCASAGGTYFYLTKPPENERLLQEGQKQLALGQYAFALRTLIDASKAKPNDPRALLALARAYVGVDQVDKAWECITKAQSMGAGIIADPSLASDLANYYRQHNQYKRAIELLRPLSAQNVKGKKAELAELDAAFGDESLRSGDLKQAMDSWEEVRELHEGSRATEADTRLASIYGKYAEQMSGKGDPEEALRYYNKLNVMAPSSTSFERAAELYQKQGNLELAIDQMEKASKLGGDPTTLNRKLAALMAARGKDLLDKGEVDAGYGYLQKAQSLDTRIKAPSATVRNAQVALEPATGYVHFMGEVWNPGPADLGSVTVRGEIFDTTAGKSVWSKEQKVVDEFVPPLGIHETRGFEIVSSVAPTAGNSNEFRVYLNNSLYKSYPLGKTGKGNHAGTAAAPGESDTTPGGSWRLAPRIQPPAQPSATTAPNTAPNAVPGESAPTTSIPTPGSSSEEKTLKDLD